MVRGQQSAEKISNLAGLPWEPKSTGIFQQSTDSTKLADISSKIDFSACLPHTLLLKDNVFARGFLPGL
jgi:hypothetical protein